MLFSNLKHFLLHLSVLISENLVNRLLDSTMACLNLAFKIHLTYKHTKLTFKIIFITGW